MLHGRHIFKMYRESSETSYAPYFFQWGGATYFFPVTSARKSRSGKTSIIAREPFYIVDSAASDELGVYLIVKEIIASQKIDRLRKLVGTNWELGRNRFVKYKYVYWGKVQLNEPPPERRLLNFPHHLQTLEQVIEKYMGREF